MAVLRCVRKWTLDATIVAAELTKCLNLEKRQMSVKSANTNNIKASKEKEVHGDWSARAEVILEFIQSKQKIKNKTKLIQPLFNILKK